MTHLLICLFVLEQILESRMVDMIGDETLPCAAGQGSGYGQVKLSLSYDSQDRHLLVIVHSCRCVFGVQKHKKTDLTLHCCYIHNSSKKVLKSQPVNRHDELLFIEF